MPFPEIEVQFNNNPYRPPDIEPDVVKEIASAVLERAFSDLRATTDYAKINHRVVLGCDSNADAVIIGEEVRDWFFEEREHYFFSFDLCCTLLDLDRNAVLERIERYREPKNRKHLGLVDPKTVDDKIYQMILVRGDRGIDYENLTRMVRKSGIHFRVYRESLARLKDEKRVYSKKVESRRERVDGKRNQVVRYYANV